MKCRSTIQSLFISFILSFGVIIHPETNIPEKNTPSAAEQEQIAQLLQFAESALVKAFSALQTIENKLTEIALLVKKGSFSKYGDSSSKIMAVLTDNKATVNALLQNQASIMSLQDPMKYLEAAFVVSEFCNAFIPYLDQQIHNSFKNTKPFDFKGFLKRIQHKTTSRSRVNHLEPASLDKQLNVTRTHLKKLDITVQEIGLTWYNKAARKVDKYIVTPANKYHLPTIGLYTAGLGIIGLYTLWHNGHLLLDENAEQLIKSKIPNPQGSPKSPVTAPKPSIKSNASGKTGSDAPIWLKSFIVNWLGYANGKGPIIRDHMTGRYRVFKLEDLKDKKSEIGGAHNQDTDLTKIPSDACMLATADHIVTGLMSNANPLAALAAGYMLKSFYETWKESIWPEVIKRRTKVWNMLRGGEYLNTYTPGLAQIKPTVSFKDMVGLDEVKKQFYSIIQYIDNPEQLMRIEATPEKGWLLSGPSRTGKTFSVECLCGEIELLMEKRGMANKIKFFNIDAALVNKFGIQAILNEVRENAPAVIFLDEIDLLGLQRVGNNALLSEFLTSMQSSMNGDPSKVVIVIAATNKPHHLDDALRQNGRFGKEINFEYPARKYRVEFIKRELANMALNINDFDAESLADKTNNKTFEDLKAVIRNAMTRSWMNGVSLTQELLEDSIDTEIRHIITTERKELPEQEKRLIAVHFAGRALAAMNLETHEQFDKVTIFARMTEIQEQGVWDNYAKNDGTNNKKEHEKRIQHGALLTKQSHDTINVKNATTVINDATVLIAGFEAEKLLLGECGYTFHEDDRNLAYQFLEKLVFGGLKKENLAKNVCEELKAKVSALLTECHEKAMIILKEHEDTLNAIAQELMVKKTLNKKDIENIIEKVKNPIIETTNDIVEAPAETPSEDAEAAIA